MSLGLRYLVDVNLLLALVDPMHEHHKVATRWFLGVGSRAWATCQATELGFVRILSQPKYPNAVDSPQSAREYLHGLQIRFAEGFAYLPGVPLLETGEADEWRLLSPKDVTDQHLLDLCRQYGTILATLDRRLAVRTQSFDSPVPLQYIAAP